MDAGNAASPVVTFDMFIDGVSVTSLVGVSVTVGSQVALLFRVWIKKLYKLHIFLFAVVALNDKS